MRYTNKMIKYESLIVFISLVYNLTTLDLPPQFKKCKFSELNECLKGAIQDALPKLVDGLPEFNFGPFQPLNIPSISIGGGASAVNLVQNYKNANIYNLAFAIVQKAEAEFTSSTFTIHLEASLNDARFEADYEFNGKILLFPIVGKGKTITTFGHTNATITFYGEEIQRKGVIYGNIKKVRFDLNVEKMEFWFENLFDGNERLGNETNKLLNDNWKEVWEDVKRGYEEIFEVVLQERSNKILNKIPLASLFSVD